MRFSSGVCAKVTMKQRVGGSSYFYDSRSVYDLLIDYFDHQTAANAEGWTELACVGDMYEADEFTIEMMEE